MKCLAIAFSIALAGCGGGTSPELYAIVVDFFTAPANCYSSGMVPTTQTTMGGLTNGQFEIWDGAEGKAFLQVLSGGRQVDMGDAPNVDATGVLEGSAGSDGWGFAVDRTVVAQPLLSMVKTTAKTHYGVTFPRGAVSKGTLSFSSSVTCEGAACPNPSVPTCVINNIAFRATRLNVNYQRPP